jgi:hypothetical protein
MDFRQPDQGSGNQVYWQRRSAAAPEQSTIHLSAAMPSLPLWLAAAATVKAGTDKK